MAEKRITVWVQRFKDRSPLMLQWIDPDTGRRKSKSAETADEKEAEQARADHECDLNNGRYQEPSKLDWERFRQLFEAEYLAGLRASTREKYTAVLDVFEQIMNPTKLRAVTERTLSQFVKGMRERKQPCNGKVGLAPMTMKNYLVALKTALGWAVSQKLIPALPTFPTVRVPKKKPQPVPGESFEKLLQKAPDALWRAYLLCGWWGGLRLSEARHLRWESSEEWPWVDFEGNRIVLPAVFAKSAEDQWVPLHPVLRQALAELPRSGPLVFPFQSRKGCGPLSRAGISSRVREMAKQAGVRLSMHKLRKGFGCRAAKQLGKGNAPILHSLMRHSSMQVTMDFYASVDDALQDAIGGLT
jgi:integrase